MNGGFKMQMYTSAAEVVWDYNKHAPRHADYWAKSMYNSAYSAGYKKIHISKILVGAERKKRTLHLYALSAYLLVSCMQAQLSKKLSIKYLIKLTLYPIYSL
jgi:hypothetical protein